MFFFAFATTVATSVSLKFYPKPIIIGNGKYERIRELGHGGFGTVYEAKNLENGKIVAIKLLDKICGQKEVKRELKAVSELRHPNIVESIDVGYDKKNREVYIVMEKCDEDLAGLLKAKGGRLSESEIKPIAGDIVEGLQYIHNKGKIHRNLKPQNILMKGGKAKIADLGLVTASSASPEMATVAGTKVYSDKHDKKVDIYSLGVITYELLVGRDHHREIENEKNLWMPSVTSRTMQSLVYGMLETDPMKRMDINQVKTHAFFDRQMQYN